MAFIASFPGGCLLPIILLFLCLTFPGSALPVDDALAPLEAANPTPEAFHTETGHKGLTRRQCTWDQGKNNWACDIFFPSLSEVIDRMHNKNDGGLADEDHSIVFFTGLGIEMDLMCNVIGHWASPQGLSYCWFENCVNWEWLYAQNDWGQELLKNEQIYKIYGDDPFQKWVACSFQALALAAQNNEVFLLIKDGTTWDKNSGWWQYEFWALTSNRNVKRIWRADPNKVMAEPGILWERDNAATYNGGKRLPPQSFCAIKYTTDPCLWWNWGPGEPIDKSNPPRLEVKKGDFERQPASLNETLNRMLGIR